MSDAAFVAPVERIDPVEQPEGAELLDPLETVGARFRLNFDPDEREFLVRLLAELKALLTSDETAQNAPLLHRLFPPAFHDDPEKEAEYQRLMREELVASRVAAIDNVTALLSPDEAAAPSGKPTGSRSAKKSGKRADRKSQTASIVLSEGDTLAFMQSLNAIRLVLGTMLDITDDDSNDAAEHEDSYEFGLYDHLGWILEFTVRALSGE